MAISRSARFAPGTAKSPSSRPATARPASRPSSTARRSARPGRIVLRRPSGKVHWLQIRDWTGTIQVMIGKAQVGDENFALAQCLDLGDIVGVDGELKRTMNGRADDLRRGA